MAMNQRFGGDWTEQKLEVLGKYLARYLTALKNKKFHKVYIDAFAGRGIIHPNEKKGIVETEFPGFEDQQRFLEGSPIRALKLKEPFDEYIFIEKQKKYCLELEERIKREAPGREGRTKIYNCDANVAIRGLCSEVGWPGNLRAVMFLDPFGMEVNWETIELIAETKAIDLWCLFPLGVALNRLLKTDGKIQEAARKKIDGVIGTKEWYDKFYKREEREPSLFDSHEQLTVIKKETMSFIGTYFNDRLKTIFAGVFDPPGVLKNSKNNPLYLLCFALGNPSLKAKWLALKLAGGCLKDLTAKDMD